MVENVIKLREAPRAQFNCIDMFNPDAEEVTDEAIECDDALAEEVTDKDIERGHALERPMSEENKCKFAENFCIINLISFLYVQLRTRSHP